MMKQRMAALLLAGLMLLSLSACGGGDSAAAGSSGDKEGVNRSTKQHQIWQTSRHMSS